MPPPEEKHRFSVIALPDILAQHVLKIANTNLDSGPKCIIFAVAAVAGGSFPPAAVFFSAPPRQNRAAARKNSPKDRKNNRTERKKRAGLSVNQGRPPGGRKGFPKRRKAKFNIKIHKKTKRRISQQPAPAPIYLYKARPSAETRKPPVTRSAPVPAMWGRTDSGASDVYSTCRRFQIRTGRYSTAVVDWVAFIERVKMIAM